MALAGAALTSAALRAEPLFRDGLEGGVPHCVPISLGASPMVDVQSVSVRPRFLLDGAPFPVSSSNAAEFVLVDAEGVQLLLGRTHEAPMSRRVRPGVYDVHYRHLSGSLVPRNADARVLQAVLISADTELPIDVPSVQIAGTVTLNDQPFPATEANRGRLSLHGVYGLGPVPLGETHVLPTVSLRLIPGSYDLVYEYLAGDSAMVPRNERARVQRLDLDASNDAQAFAISHAIVTLAYEMNGNPLPQIGSEDGTVELRTAFGDRVPMGTTSAPPAVGLIPGAYDVHYTRQSGGSIVPHNSDGVLARAIDLPDDSMIVFQSVSTSVTPLINDATPPAISIENARIVLVDRATGGALTLGETRFAADGPFEHILLPGTYDLYYQVEQSSGFMPVNPDALVGASWQPFDEPQFVLAMQRRSLFATATHNGEAFPAVGFESGRFHLQGSAPGDRFVLGDSNEAPWSRPVLTGTYAVHYQHLQGSTVPQNENHRLLETQRVSADDPVPVLPREIEVHSGPWSLQIRFDGLPLPAGNEAIILLQSPDESLALGVPNAPFALDLIEGRYEVLYKHAFGADIADNDLVRIACVDFDAQTVVVPPP